MANNLVCNECGGKMELGYVPDRGRIDFDHPFWVKGRPEINVWGNYKLKGKEKYYIAAHRCENCGFIKLFAKAKMED